MILCVPVTEDGQVDPRWGRARTVAIAEVDDGVITAWLAIDVRWDERHDESTEGSHHARVARFLLDHRVEAVVANHMGPPMELMLGRMGLRLILGASGDARAAALVVPPAP